MMTEEEFKILYNESMYAEKAFSAKALEYRDLLVSRIALQLRLYTVGQELQILDGTYKVESISARSNCEYELDIMCDVPASIDNIYVLRKCDEPSLGVKTTLSQKSITDLAKLQSDREAAQIALYPEGMQFITFKM
jgi:hypothetical protein